MTRLRRATLLLMAALLLAACSREPPVVQRQAYVFGTLVEVSLSKLPEAEADVLANRVFAEFDRLHRKFHPWAPGPMADLNRALAASPERIETDLETAEVLADAQQWHQRSEGLFDPAIGGLVALWGFHGDTLPTARLPDAAVRQWLAANPSMRDLDIAVAMDVPPEERLQPGWGSVASRNRAVRIDLGGYLKGYALDQAAAILRDAGVGDHQGAKAGSGALLNIGGNVLAIGDKAGRPWRVGIKHPRGNGTIAAIELQDGEAMGTSGDYQRYFESGGRRYSHLLDPRTGAPAQGLAAVTVLIAPTERAGTASDVASKPLFVAGPAQWPAVAARVGVTAALVVHAGGQVQATPAFAARARWSDPGQAFEQVATGGGG